MEERPDQTRAQSDTSLIVFKDTATAVLDSAYRADRIDSSFRASERITTIRLREVTLDSGLTRMLDSLIAFEKACLAEDPPNFWHLGQWKAGLFEFTGTNTVSESALGFTEVKNEVIFLYKALPDAANQNDKQRSFQQSASDAPPPIQDYSTWFIQQESGTARIVRAYTLPCN